MPSICPPNSAAEPPRSNSANLIDDEPAFSVSS